MVGSALTFQEKAAVKSKVTVHGGSLFDTQLARHTARMVKSVEVAMRTALMDKAFPLDCISRRVKTTSRLEKCVDRFLKHGNLRPRVRESIIGSISYAADVAVRLKRNNAADSDEAAVGHFLKELTRYEFSKFALQAGSNSIPLLLFLFVHHLLFAFFPFPPFTAMNKMNRIHDEGVLDAKYHQKIKETFLEKMGKYAAKEKKLRDDVEWLKNVVKKGVLDANKGCGSNLKHNEKNWKGFEESWYSAKNKEFLILSSSSAYYFLQKGEDHYNNAFLMQSPHVHISSSRIDLRVQHAMEIYHYDKTLSPPPIPLLVSFPHPRPPFPQKDPENETNEELISAINDYTVDKRAGFQRLKNSLTFKAAKDRVKSYKATVGSDSTQVIPADIVKLQDLLKSHKDHRDKAEATIKLYKTYPFLLHTNWCHDEWKQAPRVNARDLNHLKITRGGLPVWDAARALLENNERARRTLHHLTCVLRHAYSTPGSLSVDITKEDVDDTKECLELLLRMHHKDLPVPITVRSNEVGYYARNSIAPPSLTPSLVSYLHPRPSFP